MDDDAVSLSPASEEGGKAICEARESVVPPEIPRCGVMAQAPSQSKQTVTSWADSRNVDGRAIEVAKSAYAIRKIEPRQLRPSDIAGRLRATWLGKLYTRHLKRYGVIRGIAHWIWRNGYPIYINMGDLLFRGEARRWRPLTGLREFAIGHGMTTFRLAKPSIVETPTPKVFPALDQDYLASPHERYTFPEIYVVTVNDGMTYGGTNLILVGDEVICHDLYDFERDFTSEELHGRTMISPKKKRIRWLLHDEAPDSIPVAATFVDACAPNYAHWLTEVLPRIALFCAEERFKDVPIVINDGLHDNIMESLFLVAGDRREIITLPIGRALEVRKLYLTSVAGYVPFERRNAKLSGYSHGTFSPQAIEKVRSKLKLSSVGGSTRIFLRRNSGVRKVTNACEIEKLLVSLGYSIVEPEKLSFIEQAQLFFNAREVIASSGAALANMIFCPSTTEISIFISKCPGTSYWYWQNMAAASGKVIRYFLGNTPDGSLKSIHADFSISPNDVLKVLQSRSAT